MIVQVAMDLSSCLATFEGIFSDSVTNSPNLVQVNVSKREIERDKLSCSSVELESDS